MIRRCVIAVTGMFKIIALFPCAASHRYTQSFVPLQPEWHLCFPFLLDIRIGIWVLPSL